MSAKILRKVNLSMSLSMNWNPQMWSSNSPGTFLLLTLPLCSAGTTQINLSSFQRRGKGQLLGSLQGKRGSRVQDSAPQGFTLSRTSLILEGLLFPYVRGSFSDEQSSGLLREHSPGVGVGWYVVQSDYRRL